MILLAIVMKRIDGFARAAAGGGGGGGEAARVGGRIEALKWHIAFGSWSVQCDWSLLVKWAMVIGWGG